jgi:hypothetical protein
MEFHSTAYSNFENNVLNLRRLSFGLRYLKTKKKEYIEWLKKNGERFPEAVFNQELENTINLELEISNILLKSYIERFGYEKCGTFDAFIKQYKTEIDSYKIEYQRDLPPLPVLNINRELRNQSIHSEPTYKLIKSSKIHIEILSERAVRITNDSGDKKIVLLHDLEQEEWGSELKKASSNVLQPNNMTFMTYGELLRDEVKECIRKIDLITGK